MYDGFISCNSKDYSLGNTVYEFLTTAGHHIFFCDRTLLKQGNSYYRKTITNALGLARHLIIVSSDAKNISYGWVQWEWGLFLNELLSGRKDSDSNIVLVFFEDIQVGDIPLDIRDRQALFWHRGGQEQLLDLLPDNVQEIFRIDLFSGTIYWGKRPLSHRGLRDLDTDSGLVIDGDKKRNVVRIWVSRYAPDGLARLQKAKEIILQGHEIAAAAGVNLRDLVIEDNNGMVV